MHRILGRVVVQILLTRTLQHEPVRKALLKGSKERFWPAWRESMYGWPVEGGLRHRVRRERKEMKWVCRACQEMSALYLKSIMCVCVGPVMMAELDRVSIRLLSDIEEMQPERRWSD